jgi:glycosyltransferase involved in cell wall biosynthesis
MKRSGQAANAGRAPRVLTAALEEVAGAALVLDPELRIVAATGEAETLLGVSITPGIAAPKLLCGQASERPVAEALAAGRPVVAPASAGPLEIVTPACGRLYAPRDADAGAVALRDVLMDPAAPAAARARAAAFDGAAAARRFAAVLERLH